MIRNRLSVSRGAQHSSGTLLSLTSIRPAVQENQEQGFTVKETRRHEIRVDRSQLPLTVHFGEKTYILVLTRSNKLLLQKPF